MFNEVYRLCSSYYNTETLNHCRRIGQRAVQLGWDEEVVAACYLHELLVVRYDEYYEALQEIKAINENVAKIVDKVTKKEKETWPQYYYRIYLVKEAAQVVWLDALDTMVDCDEVTLQRIHKDLFHVYSGIHKYITTS